MNEGTAVGVGFIACAAVVAMIIAAIWVNVDSVANCARSCDGKMMRHTEEQRAGTMKLVPVCECRP